jgi:hypothetical protein
MHAPSTRNAYRWRPAPKLQLVIVQFVSQNGVGVFVRGEKGINPTEVEHRLDPCAARLNTAERADDRHRLCCTSGGGFGLAAKPLVCGSDSTLAVASFEPANDEVRTRSSPLHHRARR